MSGPDRRDRGALESEVLAALGGGGRAMTPREVQVALGGGLAYTTVMTTLARLCDKGALSRQRDGRAYAYRLTGDARVVEAAVTARGMRKVLDAGADRAVALSRFVSELEPEDEQLLAELVRKLELGRPEEGDS